MTMTTEEIRDAFCESYPDHLWGIKEQDFNEWLIAERKRVAEMAIKKVFAQFSRVTLVDDDRGGIQYERYHVHVEPSIQDNGYTLKLFVKENNNE